MSCTVCGVMSDGGQFCVGCGQRLAPALAPASTTLAVREAPHPPRNAWLALQEIRLLACPKCGAPNSAARWHCARCGTEFDEQTPAEPAAVEPVAPAADEATAVQPEAAPWLTLVTVVAGVAVVAVAAVMLVSRGVGPFGGRSEPTAVARATPVAIADARASSSVDAAANARNLIDGDTGSAWRADAAGADWVELELAEPARVDHLLVWNGDQASGASFAAANRVTEALIYFPDLDKAYRAPFEDIDDNFRIDIPQAPTADRIRIKITKTEGDHDVTALSEIEALVSTAPLAE